MIPVSTGGGFHMPRKSWPIAMLLYAFLFLAGGSAAPARAQQTGTLSGVVTNAGTLRPLAGVQVHIPGTGLGTLTAANGRYQLVNVPAGEVTVVAEMIGFARQTRTVRVTAGAAATLDVAI